VAEPVVTGFPEAAAEAVSFLGSDINRVAKFALF